MPAFTAAAAFLVAEIGGITLAAAVGSAGITLITSVVATGLAIMTSRLINGGGSDSGGGGTQQNQGTRVQLAPATENKIPVVYGTANTKGLITDARISADNQQMTYVLVLSERTQTGTHTIGDIFWNDELLTFDTGANSYKVASSRDQNGLGDTSTNYAGLVEMRVYAGDATTSTNQIFPTTNKISAQSYLGEASTSTYDLSGLVYAVVKLTYNAEKSVTNLAQMTFEVQNSLSNPGLVLYDYLTSPRYGAGIASTEIDTDSMTNLSLTTSLRSISNEIPPNQYESDGVTTSTQARYIVNGVLSTGEAVKNNLEKITQVSASWLTYDFTQGKWSVVVNRALSSGELAACVVYDDDSIMGEVTVNATNLEDLYNSLEVEFASREIRDQNDYFRASIDPAERNDLEPDNTLNLRYELINNAIHAQRLGSIELFQSRVDKTIQFNTTYKGLQSKAGDVIKVTNEVYGFDEKLFRITRVREVENQNGSLTAEITALEYDAAVYGDETINDYAPNTASGIPSFSGSAALPAPGAVVIGSSFPTNNQPYFEVSTQISATSGPVDQIQWYYLTGTSYVYVTNEVGPFTAGQTVTDTVAGLPAGSYYLYAKSIKDGVASAYSSAGGSNQINWNPQPGGVSNGTISTATFSSQVQVVNTTSGALKVPLVATTSGYQPIYADSELSYDAATNVMTTPGGIRFTSTGSYIEANWGQQVAANDRSVIRSITANTSTGVYVAPTGSGDGCSINLMTTSSLWQSGRMSIGTTAAASFINVTRNNTNVPFQNLAIQTGGITRMTVNSSTGVVSITTTTDSTTIGTGGLVLSGGLGVAKAITVGGAVVLNTTTNATTTQTGALIVGGGIGVGKDVYIGGTLNAPGTYHTEVSRSSDISVSTSSDVVIQFNKTNSDPQSWYNSGTYKITPTVAGYYLVQMQVSWDGGTGGGQQNIQIRKNGTTFSISIRDLYTGGIAISQQVFGVVQLNGSTDYIDATVYTNSSTGQNLKGAADGSYTKITLTRLQ